MMLTRESNALKPGKIEMKAKKLYLSNKDMNFIVKRNRKSYKRNEHFLHSKME